MIAGAFLALGFGAVSVILLFVEPGMGFAQVADFFDPAKVLTGAASLAWLSEDLIYLGFGVALGFLAVQSDDRYLRASGLVAATLFFLIGNLGRVLAVLPDLIAEPGQLHAAVLGLLPVRLAALRTCVFALGIFAWRTTREPASEGNGTRAWRSLGYVVLGGAIVFLFVFIPVPLLFAVWAAWLTVRKTQNS